MAPTDLPAEVTPASSAGGIIRASVLAVAIVTALNAVMAFHLSSNEIDLVSTKWARLASHPEPVEWLFLGDSSCNQGLDPERWAELGGGSALNLCTVAYVTVANAAWMLRDWTAKHGPPRGVVVVHTVDTWAREFETSELISYPFEWGFWERREPPLQLTWGDQRDLLLLRFVPMLSRSGRLSNMANLRAGDDDDAQETLAFNPGTFVRADGFMPWPTADPPGVERDARELGQYLRDEPFHLSDLNRAALAELGAYADDHGVPLLLFNAPLYDGLVAQPGYQTYQRAIDTTLTEFADQHDTVHYVAAIYTVDARRLMIVDHITAEGAHDYTTWVKEVSDDRLTISKK